jgi:acetyl-CoA hydrolase
MHLSQLPQYVRYGFLGKVHWAIAEACDVTPGGGIVLSTSVGATNTFFNQADKVLIELNRAHSPELLGMHDIFEPEDPPARAEIPIYSVRDRIGSPIAVVPKEKIVGIVETNMPDEAGGFDQANPCTTAIGHNVAELLVSEMRAGRIPKTFLPLQSGVGNIANCVLEALGSHPEIPAFEVHRGASGFRDRTAGARTMHLRLHMRSDTEPSGPSAIQQQLVVLPSSRADAAAGDFQSPRDCASPGSCLDEHSH